MFAGNGPGNRESGMSLTNCPECKKEISNKAQTCPHCGAPTNFSQPVLGGFFESPTRTIIFLLVCLALLVSRCGDDKKEAARPSPEKQALSSPCTPEQLSHAKAVLSVLQGRGHREVAGSGVWYVWRENWYGMDFQRQMDTMRLVADTEYCVSGGAIKHMHIDFNGEHVAEATPNGGVRVLKSRP